MRLFKSGYSLKNNVLLWTGSVSLCILCISLAVVVAASYRYASLQLKQALAEAVYGVAEDCINDLNFPHYSGQYDYNISVNIHDEDGILLAGEEKEILNDIPFHEGKIYDIDKDDRSMYILDVQVDTDDGAVFFVRGMAEHTSYLHHMVKGSSISDFSGKYPGLIFETDRLAEHYRYGFDDEDLENDLWYKEGNFFCILDKDGNRIEGMEPDGFQSIPITQGKPHFVRFGTHRYVYYDKYLCQMDGERYYLRGICRFAEFASAIHYGINTALILQGFMILLLLVFAHVLMDMFLKPLNDVIHQTTRITEGKHLRERVKTKNSCKEFHELENTINQMLEKLEISFEMETRFTSDAAHEMRSPLASIMNHCEYCLEMDDISNELRHELQMIHDRTEHLTNLIQMLLTVGKMEKGVIKPVFEETDASQLLADIVDELEPEASAAEVKLQYRRQQEVMLVADTTILIQMVFNLIRNAIQYSFAGGKVMIDLCEEAEEILIRISDEGIGIPEEDLTRIFQRFYRTEISTHKCSGYGLGLNLVKLGAELHKGYIDVQSSPMHGSTFTLHLSKKPAVHYAQQAQEVC